MLRTLALSLAMLLVAGSTHAAEIESGLTAGEHAPAFQVKDITGPKQGTSLCYRCRYGGRPVVSIFTRKMDAEVQALVDELDSVVGANGEKQMAAFVVVLSEDEEADSATLTKVAKEKSIEHTPLTIYEGVTGPPAYKIAKDADVTVLMWKGQTVKVNHAFAPGKLDEKAVKAIVADTKQILE
jgi:hypothetical protein